MPPILLLLTFVSGDIRSLIYKDFVAWCAYKNYPIKYLNFLILFADYREFRSVVYRRLGPLRYLICWLFKGQDLLFISKASIGGGLLIQHGFSTIINAKSIGKNCKVYQQVTIGNNGEGRPIIGDNVVVCSGAKIIGGITVGNDVIVGANAVVCKDVPDHCVVAGVPAKIIKRRNSMDDSWVKL